MSSDFELMWKSVLAVFRSQWDYVKGNKRHEEAYKSGIKTYQDYYSDQLLKQTRAHSARRIREIELLLSSQISPQKRHMLAQDMNRLYQGSFQAFGRNHIVGARGAREVELEQCIQDLAAAKDVAQREIVQSQQAFKERPEYLNMLATGVEVTSTYEDEFCSMVLEARDQLLRQILLRRIREAVRAALPRIATVLVVSKGDEELLQLNVKQAWHFPQNEEGVYAGHYPADSAEAIAHLEALREKGAEFLLFPDTAFWWLDYYKDFREHLDTHYRCIWSDERCIIYRLDELEAGEDENHS